MIVWIDTILQGVLLGGLYALYATGLSLIFGIMRLVNLAHGDLIVLAAYVILLIATALGIDILPPLLVTFGLSIVIQNGLLEAFSANNQRLPIGDLAGISIPLGEGL